jgi:hypothetical protein
MIDTPYWFGSVPEGCDVPGWVPYMTAAELGLDSPKLTIDFGSGEVYVSYPPGWQQAEVLAVTSPGSSGLRSGERLLGSSESA